MTSTPSHIDARAAAPAKTNSTLWRWLGSRKRERAYGTALTSDRQSRMKRARLAWSSEARSRSPS